MRYTSHDWRGVWVGLDLAELAGFAATAWAAWHQRQVLIVLMNVTGTLLVCDAWFDLALAYGSRGFTMSLVTALLVELPLGPPASGRGAHTRGRTSPPMSQRPEAPRL